MLSILYLQSEPFGLIVAILLILVIIIISIAIWRSKKKTNNQNSEYDPNIKFAQTLTDVPTKQEVATIKEEIIKLREFQDKQKLEIIQYLEGISEKNAKEGKEKIDEQIIKSLEESGSATRAEFEKLVARVNRIIPDDSNTQKIIDLANIFDSKKQSVITWKCKLLKLLRNGVSPDIDEERFARESIPSGSVLSFLKKLVTDGIVNKNQIDSFSLNESHEWIYSYIDNPVWLKEQIEEMNLVKKEKEYQKWLKDNLEKIEPGLLKEEREVIMEGTGTIDFLCRDVDAKPVGLELKYPKAAKRDVKQLMAYAEEYRGKADGTNFRGMMVAPEIVPDLRDTLEQYNLEWKEVPFDTSDVEEKSLSVEEDQVFPTIEKVDDPDEEDDEEWTKVQEIDFEESSRGSMPKGWKSE